MSVPPTAARPQGGPEVIKDVPMCGDPGAGFDFDLPDTDSGCPRQEDLADAAVEIIVGELGFGLDDLGVLPRQVG
jgi:hypothetical protein